MSFEDKVRGTLYGQAIGDALGLGTEFMTREEVRKHYPRGFSDYDEIIRDDHRKRWREGSWTDDTDQMLCILDSILEKKTIDLKDISKRFYRWAASGGIDIGRTVFSVLSSQGFLEDPHAASRKVWEETGREGAANGAIMRTSVLGVWDSTDPVRIRENAAGVCKITHYDPRCVGSCVMVCLAISSLIHARSGVDGIIEEVREEGELYDPRIGEYLDRSQESLASLELDEGLDPASGSDDKTGYTLKAMGAAFWALKHAISFEDGLMRIIMEGGDADSNGAVAGAVLGASFGFSAIPSRLVKRLNGKKRFEKRVASLLKLLK